MHAEAEIFVNIEDLLPYDPQGSRALAQEILDKVHLIPRQDQPRVRCLGHLASGLAQLASPDADHEPVQAAIAHAKNLLGSLRPPARPKTTATVQEALAILLGMHRLIAATDSLANRALDICVHASSAAALTSARYLLQPALPLLRQISALPGRLTWR